MEELYRIIYIKTTLCFIGIFIHCIGIYALAKTRRKTNQVIILLNLSISEIIMLSSFAVSSVAGLVFYKEANYEEAVIFNDYRYSSLPDIFVIWKGYATQLAVALTSITLMFLTTDRFIHTVLPFWFAAAAEDKSVFKKLIVGSWIFSVLFCLLVTKEISIVTRFTLGLTILAILTIVVCYAIILIKIRHSRRNVLARGQISQRREGRIASRKHQLVPGLIIVTFFFFYVISYSIYSLYFNKNIKNFSKDDHPGVELTLMAVISGLISDALIYVFFTRENRKIVVKLFCCCVMKRSNRRVRPFTTTASSDNPPSGSANAKVSSKC